MSEYTKGPWRLDGRTVYALEHWGWKKGFEQFHNRFNVHVSGNNNTPLAELEANARLIAAAPELLEALESFPMLLAPATTAWGRQVQDWQDKALAAIAKATGK